MEAIKAYSVPVEAPGGLIDAYMEVKGRALELVLAHVSFNGRGRTRLRLKAEERREMRNGLLKNWSYATHYVDSAINSVIGLIKGWMKLYNRGKAKRKPKLTRRAVYVKTTLFRVKESRLIITIEPRKSYLEIDLSNFGYLPEDHDSIGGLILTDEKLHITFKRSPEPLEPTGWSAFDVNEANVTEARDKTGIVRYDIRELYQSTEPTRSR